MIAFLQKFPDSLIVNLGAGLCTRFVRMDNGKLIWVEIDLQEVEEVWKKFNTETERHRFLTGSVLNFGWMDSVKELKQEGQDILFIAEGLLPYFSEQDVKSLIIEVENNFPGSEMLVEAIGPIFAKMATSHDTLSKLGVKFDWGIENFSEMEAWNNGIKLIEEWNIIDRHTRRWKWMNILKLPFLKKQFGKIAHFRFEQNEKM